MKKLFSLSLIASFIFSSAIYAQRTCGTMDHLQYLISQDPKMLERMKNDEAILEQYISEHADGSGLRDIITLPVVVHVVYKSSDQNISDDQVQSQIDVLNEDYQRMN